MFRRFLIGFIILCLGFSVFPNAAEVEASTTSKKQLIIINKKVNKLAFYENGKLVKTYSVATGRTSKLTPEGTFYIREKVVNRPWYKGNIPGGHPNNPLGKRWLGLSKQENGGYPYGIHGNNNESSIGKYVSGGCIRMHNKEVVQLFSKVKKGTKVIIASTKKSFNQLAASHYKNIDYKAPSVPAVTVSDKSSEVSGKTEKGATVTVKIGSKNYTAKPADSQGKFKVKIPKQKAGKKLYLSVKDKAGNISKTKTVVVKDKTAPKVPTVNMVSDKSTVVYGKTEAKAYVTVTIGSKKYPVKRADVKGNYKVTISKQKAGQKISVKAADAAKNVSSSKTVTVLDKTAPSVPTVNPVADNVKEVSGKTEAYAYITVTIGSKNYPVKRADARGNYKVTIPQQKAGNKISVKAADAAKNVSSTKTVTVLDKTAPSVTVNPVADNVKEVSGKTEALAYVTVKIGSWNSKATQADKYGNYKVTIPQQKAGIKVDVTAKDKAGNVSKAKSVVVIDKTAPVVSGVTNNTTYNQKVTISFTEGKATLDGTVITTGTDVDTEGPHTFVLTDAAGNKTTVEFTIDIPDPVTP